MSVEGQAMKLEELINKAGDMKVLPSVARKVMEMVEREDVSGNQLAEAISKDQALSAHLLKAANSALFGLPREITTVLMAVNVLGFKNTRDMTIMAATRGVYKRFGITEKMLWTHSVSAAIGAKTIASQLRAIRTRRCFHLRSAPRCGQGHLEQRVPRTFLASHDANLQRGRVIDSSRE